MIHTDGRNTIANRAAAEVEWWASGNSLALIRAMRQFAFGKSDPALEARMNSGLIGAARAIGMDEDDIRAAFHSDEDLTIYAP